MKISRDGLLLLVACVFFFALGASAKDQEFRLEKPDAQSVGLAGEFNNWKAQAMTKGNDGVWTMTVSLSPGTYGYKSAKHCAGSSLNPQRLRRESANRISTNFLKRNRDDRKIVKSLKHYIGQSSFDSQISTY